MINDRALGHLKGKSSKNKTLWKWNIFLSVKQCRQIWKRVKCDVWTRTVVCVCGGGGIMALYFSVTNIQVLKKTVCNIHTSKSNRKWVMPSSQVLIRRENALLHSSSSAPPNSPAPPGNPECDAALPEPIKYEWPLVSSYTTRPQYLAHDDRCQEDSVSLLLPLAAFTRSHERQLGGFFKKEDTEAEILVAVLLYIKASCQEFLGSGNAVLKKVWGRFTPTVYRVCFSMQLWLICCSFIRVQLCP